MMSVAIPVISSPQTPVYFLGVGGPSFIEATNHPGYVQLAVAGREITTQVKPKAVVVFSAHWQADPTTIKVNVAENTEILYDFEGLPERYYTYKYPYKGSTEIAEKVVQKLDNAGFDVERVERGLDHGAWAGFLIADLAFDPKNNPLDVPIVQVSLYSNENTDQHYRVGQALESLRNEGVLIVGTGMAVYNLRDYLSTKGTGQTMSYTVSFDAAIKEAATAAPEERPARFSALMDRSDAREAHPTLDHILPLYVAAGAAGSDVGKQMWTYCEGSLSWAQYRFGEISSA